jgi:hypothetical protein
MSAAAHIAHALGGTSTSGGFVCRCPVPSHGAGRGDRNPSLSIREGETGLLVRCHAGCDARDVLATLRRRGLLGDGQRSGPQKASVRKGLAQQRPAAGTDRVTNHERRQREKAAWLWSQRRPLANSIAERYLRDARRYFGPLPPTLAFLPPSEPEHHPAMIAAFGSPEEPEPGVLGEPSDVDAVHLTLLRSDGTGKADANPNKLVIARPFGRPIVVAPPNDMLGLAITEGIEDALTAHEATGLGAWAAGSAGFMQALAKSVPVYIEAITIFAHADKAGRRGAHNLAEWLSARGVEVRIDGAAE